MEIRLEIRELLCDPELKCPFFISILTIVIEYINMTADRPRSSRKPRLAYKGSSYKHAAAGGSSFQSTPGSSSGATSSSEDDSDVTMFRPKNLPIMLRNALGMG